MFTNIGWGEMLVLVVVGLVVLGPERLPGAIRWTSGALRQVRDYLSGVTNQLREDIGPEFDDLRGQFRELQKLRGMTPRAALTKHLFDGDNSLFTGNSVGWPIEVSPRQKSTQPVQQHGPAPFDTDAT
ncbi:Sec-independent protein translocase TatB [Mycobacterium uberis]|uniref:Sec-independent protein translocase protein TatB n=1 Tax=Mycobacterium uberis TaxID=2162698 RepID=A0A3E1HJX6_9MYCO|nr:Sec-independent protein translocase protein TatB [Mycobacterium uberis]RFD26790.1 Sec-independent protein translocase TatB [Mycobacterium uberis]